MEVDRFDTLTRTLTTLGPRRAVLGHVLSGVLGLLGSQVADVSAKKKKKKNPCPPCKARKLGTCKANVPDGSFCVGGTCQGGVCMVTVVPPPLCAAPDGIKNGTETGVDCGGPCNRCGNGQGCATQHDCLSAFCANGVCQECAPGLCGSDSNGPCACTVAKGSGLFVCRTSEGFANSSCTCPPGTSCFNVMAQDGCYKLCAAL
jgi:hypothetical protein